MNHRLSAISTVVFPNARASQITRSKSFFDDEHAAQNRRRIELSIFQSNKAMKTFIIAFLLGIIAGGIAVNMLKTRESPSEVRSVSSGPPPANPTASIRDTAHNLRDSIADKLEE